ncbi:TPA: hypothetical protein ACIVAT_000639 [Salmonella enterica subsp. enterica serovar Waycross]
MTTPSELAEKLAKSADEYIAEGHTPVAILRSAMGDFKLAGGMGAALGVMMSGKLSAQQTAYIERAGAKLLAALSLMEAKDDLSKKSG